MPAQQLSVAERDQLVRAVESAGGAKAYGLRTGTNPITVARACAGYPVYSSTAKALLAGAAEPAANDATPKAVGQ